MKSLDTKAIRDFAYAHAIKTTESSSDVGAYIKTDEIDKYTAVIYFESHLKGYKNWIWAVSVSTIGRGYTLSEVNLLATPDALQPPKWVSWVKRLEAKDLGPSDIVPYIKDDENLQTTAVTLTDEEKETLQETVGENIAIERERVLSPVGIEKTAARWYNSSRGPMVTSAKISAKTCSSCGYFIPLQSRLSLMFGVCANQVSADDGRIVSHDHGCGAHSETGIKNSSATWDRDRSIRY
ncbi:MAG: DUF3027 domain-containing protein [Bifidobacteriaceae bacterium]|jgi:hypothetical protein|nr:DUF3027 domain-containing protein [Bifidobacteriaceae bacterium]